jgi:NitT/TauT family transport system substrate-binding protein
MRKLLLTLIAGMAITIVVAACGSDDGEEGTGAGERASITLGISPFQDTLLPVVAEEKGWFGDVRLDVELKELGWDAIMPAVASGAVDVAINNTTGVISIANRQPDAVYWYGWNPFTEGAALMGRKGGDLRTLEQFEREGMSEEQARRAAVEQLAGKTIVTTLSSDMGKAVNSALASVGMTRDDVEIVDQNPDQGLAAFLSGTGDAYLGGIPQRTRLVKEGMPIILSGPDLAPPPINGFVTTKEYAEGNRDALLRLMNVMFRVVRYCDARTDQCGRIVIERLNRSTGGEVTVDDFEAFWQKLENYAGNAAEVQDSILSPRGYAYWRETWDTDNEYLVEQEEAIPEPVDGGEHFWGDRVQKAYVDKYGPDEKGY